MNANENLTCIGNVVPLLVIAALFYWGRSVAKKHGTRGWRIASRLPLAALALYVVGMALTVVGLVRAFGALGDAPGAEKATMLAEGISVAMNATAFGAGGALLICIGSAIAFAIGSLRAPPASAAQPTPPAEPTEHHPS